MNRSPLDQEARDKKPSVFVLIAISWLAPMGINIFAPSIPSIEKSLDTTYANVTLCLLYTSDAADD